MADVIQLLPDNVANQIAAGEVVQRPASVVKELLENAVDAGATQIRLVVREAGKTLIQVIDNGCGMSETDARMSFERHATSKIRDAKDLFALRTMGFRGEALASIAAVAQVELRTRRAIDELGTRVIVEDSAVRAHEPCQNNSGTSISVKNLFYNVPARRNFLRSDSVEMRHVLDEFQRVAIANPDLMFTLHHNDQEVYHLPQGSLRHRIVKMYGEPVNKKLVPVAEETEILKITGFVGKPDYFKKNRGEQLFFVNKRFIKSNYLQHAVTTAYEDLLPDGTFPFYVLFLEIDPARIDVNVHPTKQEIKFDDERLVYNFLKVTVRHALGRHNIMPTLDFEQEPAFQSRPERWPAVPPSEPSSGGSQYPNKRYDNLQNEREENNRRQWEKAFANLDFLGISAVPELEDTPTANNSETPNFEVRSSDENDMLLDSSDSLLGGRRQKEPYQLHGQYIISQIKSGFLLIDQHAASERILYERYLDALRQAPIATQQLLFPKSMDFNPADALLLRDLLPEINKLGFEVAEFGGNTFVIHGTPADLSEGVSTDVLLDRLLSQFRENLEFDLGIHDNLARVMAANAALRRGQQLSPREMQELIDQLFACSIPFKSPSGRHCFLTFELDELSKRFNS